MTNRNAASMGTYGAAWTAHGYSGHAGTAQLVDRHAGSAAVVAGNASGVFGEVETALSKHPDAIIFAANDVGMYLPKLHHWVSLHGAHLANWKAVRWQNPKEYEVTEYHSPDRLAHINWCWEGLTPLFPLSGYFAMQIALIMGCSPIILCGCPGSAVARFFEAAPRQDFSYGQAPNDKGIQDQVRHETDRVPELRHAVRSMSGWTKDFFGGM